MLRNLMMTGTAICLSMGSSLARADHGDGLRYIVGGALIGAAIGELAYATNHRAHVVVDYGYRPYGYAPYGYDYRGYRAYPRRHFAGPRDFRRWRGAHGWRHGARHRHHRYCRH